MSPLEAFEKMAAEAGAVTLRSIYLRALPAAVVVMDQSPAPTLVRVMQGEKVVETWRKFSRAEVPALTPGDTLYTRND